MSTNEPAPAWYASNANTIAVAKNMSANQMNFPTAVGTVGTYWAPQPQPLIWSSSTTYEASIDEILRGYLEAGETWPGAIRRILAEYSEMKQVLRELAVLADNHGEDTIAL